MFFKSKDVKVLEAENERLTNVDTILRGEIRELKEGHRKEKISLENDISRLETSRNWDYDEAHRKYLDLNNKFNDKVDRAISQTKKSLEKEFESKEKNRANEHKNLISKTEREHAEKIAKCDRALEQDKSNYRKYLRTENNKQVDHLTTDNARLVKENAALTGENKALVVSNTTLTKQASEALALVGTQLKNSFDLAQSAVCAMPDISADFTTPESNIIVTGSNQSPRPEVKKS